MFRISFRISTSCLALSLPFVSAQSRNTDHQNFRMIRPSELPLYEETKDLSKYDYHEGKKSKLEESISAVIHEVESFYSSTKEFRNSVNHVTETGKAHLLVTLGYLADEENIGARYGAIGIGGMLGFVLGGWRKGILKKLFYGSISAGGVASLLYPDDAYRISSELFENAGTYSSILYNFVAGVKPHIATESKLPTFNETLSKNSGISQTKDVVLLQPNLSGMNTPSSVSGDVGQGNPEDSDLYSTRS